MIFELLLFDAFILWLLIILCVFLFNKITELKHWKSRRYIFILNFISLFNLLCIFLRHNDVFIFLLDLWVKNHLSFIFWFLLNFSLLFLFFIFHYLVRLWKFNIFLFCRWGLYFIFSNFSILLWFLTFYGLFGWFCRFNFFHRFLSFCRFALSFYCWRLFFFFDLLFLYFLTFHLNFVGFLLWVSISRFWPLSSWWRSFLYWLRRNNRFWFWFNLLHLNSFWL